MKVQPGVHQMMAGRMGGRSAGLELPLSSSNITVSASPGRFPRPGLGAWDREQNYQAQNGTTRLTSRQVRRIDRKVNHALAVARRNRGSEPEVSQPNDFTRLIRSGNPAMREAGYRLRYDELTRRWQEMARGTG